MTPDHPNAYALVCNKGYLPYAQFVAWMLTRNGPPGADIVICSGENLGDVGGDAKFLQVDVSPVENDLPTTDRWGVYGYWSIPAIEALSSLYQKILYLDVDVIIDGSAPDKLFGLDLGTRPVAAVLDIHQRQRPNRMPREFTAMGMPHAPYFNAGVMLVDGTNWRRMDMAERLYGIALSNPDAITAVDQSLLNIALHMNWVELAPVWNWQYTDRFPFGVEWLSPRIIHFVGPTKPWSVPNGRLPDRYHRLWRLYADAEGMSVTSPASSHEAARRLGRATMLKSWYYDQRLRAYARAFPTDLTTVIHGGS